MRSRAPCRIASAIDTARDASRFFTSLPSTSATSSGVASASGEFGICLARRNSSTRTASAVVTIPFDTEAAIHDPPSTGDCGNVESPSLIVTLSSGNPSISAATCAMIVYVPVPMSEVAQETSAWPLAVSRMRTAIGTCSASQTPVAIPQPTRSVPSRIERGSGLRLSQPNASAPWR